MQIVFGLIIFAIFQSLSVAGICRNLQTERGYSDFRSYLVKFNKKYKDPEECGERFKLFKEYLKNIPKLQVSDQGTARYGITQFADMTPEEKSMHFGLITPTAEVPVKKAKIPRLLLPTYLDWRQHNAVSHVRTQGNCQSCYAFATAANIEGVWAVKYQTLYRLSTQQTVDCDIISKQCSGGYIHSALYYAGKHGLQYDSDYRYTARNQSCIFDSSRIALKTKGFVRLPISEDSIAQYISFHGPIATGVNGDLLNSYISGIMNPPRELCNTSYINHGIAIVGFGETVVNGSPLQYWICKNSWGPYWGEQGFFRIVRGMGACAINLYAYSARV